MPQINKRKLCNKHNFYDSIIYPNGCPKCRKESNKQYDSNIRSEDRKKIYNSTKWKQVRELAMIRDEFLCVECKKLGILTKGEEVDHIEELQDRMDLAYDLDNLQLLCRKHHRDKTEREKIKRT